jgi:lipopolysaccharide export system protein LptA
MAGIIAVLVLLSAWTVAAAAEDGAPVGERDAGTAAAEEADAGDSEIGREQPPKLQKPSRPTDIQADSMDMNLAKGTATFDGSVVVTDGDIKLTADRMVVHFSQDRQLTKVEAKGDVTVIQPSADREAVANEAVYDVTAGTVTLTGTPRLRMGENVLENAEKITYFRDSERVITTGKEGKRPRIRIVPEDDQPGLDFFRQDEDHDETE